MSHYTYNKQEQINLDLRTNTWLLECEKLKKYIDICKELFSQAETEVNVHMSDFTQNRAVSQMETIIHPTTNQKAERRGGGGVSAGTRGLRLGSGEVFEELGLLT